MGAWRDDNGQGLKCAVGQGVREGVGDSFKPLLNQELAALDFVGLDAYFNLENGCFWSFGVLLACCDGVWGPKFNLLVNFLLRCYRSGRF